MSTETANLYQLPSSDEMAEELKAEAKKHFDALKKASGINSTSSLRIGWHAHRLKRKSLFGILGFETENEAREAAEIGESTWYANLRLAEDYDGLDEDQFCSMKQRNAKKMADLPESKRMSREWVRMAGSMPFKKFAPMVDEEMGDKAKASDGKEKATVLKMPVPVSRKQVIEDGLKEYAKSIGIDEGDPGKAMELLVVEKTGQMGLVEAITNAVQRTKEAIELRNSGLSAEETLEKVYVLLGDMILDFEAALNGVQNLDSPAA